MDAVISVVGIRSQDRGTQSSPRRGELPDERALEGISRVVAVEGVDVALGHQRADQLAGPVLIGVVVGDSEDLVDIGLAHLPHGGGVRLAHYAGRIGGGGDGCCRGRWGAIQ